MTLVIALQGSKSIWLLTDRRLTYPTKQRNDACKMLTIEGTDGVALVGYAGLGASLRGTEPSEWMNDHLAGLPVGKLEDYLGTLADAMQTQLPPQLSKMPGPQVHHVLAPALIGGEPRLYGIALQLGPNGQSHFNYTRFARTLEGGPPPRIALAGSGRAHIPPLKQWYRHFFRLVLAFERGLIAAETLADEFAALNAHAAKRDNYVSQECIVAWRGNGGGHQFYAGTERVTNGGPIPTVVNGMDLRKIMQASWPSMRRTLASLLDSNIENVPGEIDGPALEAEVNRLHRLPKKEL